MKTVLNWKDSITGLLSGTNLDNVNNLNGCLERASRSLIQTVKCPEATGRQLYSIYDRIYDYPAPLSIFGGSLIDFRPQGINRSMNDYNYKLPIEQFDRTKAVLPNGYSLTFEWNKGVGIFRVSQRASKQGIVLDHLQDATGWTAGGNASGLATDNTVYYESPASLRFNLSAGGSQGTLTKTISSSDLTNYIGTGVVFIAVELPTASNFTSIGVKLGSDASNYYSMSNTTGFLGAWTSGEFLIIALDTAMATKVGTPVLTAMDYCQVFFNYNGTAQVNVRLGNIFIALPSLHEMIFASSAIFMASGQAPLSTITTVDDSILLSDSAYTLLEHFGALEVAFQISGGAATAMTQQEEKKLFDPINGLVSLYRADNPSQEIRTTGSWYDD